MIVTLLSIKSSFLMYYSIAVNGLITHLSIVLVSRSYSETIETTAIELEGSKHGKQLPNVLRKMQLKRLFGPGENHTIVRIMGHNKSEIQYSVKCEYADQKQNQW